MLTRTRIVGVLALAVTAFLAGCETVTTTVVDGQTGRPLPHTRVRESNGAVRYTDASGTVNRTPGTTARITRSGYRSVSTSDL